MDKGKKKEKEEKKRLKLSKHFCVLFAGGSSGKEPACQCRRPKRYGFDPWAGKIPWKRA